MGTIFEYMNYRDYLRNLFEKKKKDNPYYSYRLFSQKAGFKSPNFLKLIIDGKRNLTKESVYRVSKAFGLNKKECDYLENLVFFNQSKTLEEKNVYLTRVMRHRVKKDPKKLEASEYAYYSNWYNPVICELVTAIDFNDDYEKLARLVIPEIAENDVKKAIELLLRLSLIKKNSDGTYSSAAASLTTGPQVRSIAIANYHKAMIALGSESIERFSSNDRDITSVTVGVSDETRGRIMDKIQQLRREILELAEAEKNAEKIIQVNFQLFPLTSSFKQEDEPK